MKKVSKKQSKINRELYKLKCDKLEECGYKCSCGSTYSLELSHIIPKGREKKHELNPLNSLIECHECHNIWEHGTWDEKFNLGNFGTRIENMRKIDELYYNRQLTNMPEYLQIYCEYLDSRYFDDLF